MNKNSLLLLLLTFLLIPLPLPAAVQFWDPDGATIGTSVSGNWNTATANWTDTADSGVNTVWGQGNEASFGVLTNYTVTLTEPVTVGNLTLIGTNGTLTISGTSVNNLILGASVTLNTSGRSVIISAPIDGSFDLTRSGGGTVTLSGASTYSGGTTLTAGTLALGVDSVFSGGVIISGPVGTGTILNNASTTLQASGSARILDNPITLNGNLTISGSSALTFRNGGWLVNGAGRTVTVNNTADTTLAGNLTDDGTARTLTKAGTGKLILSGDNSTYLGAVTVTGGRLVAGSPTAIPSKSVITVNGTGILDLNGIDLTINRLASSNATPSQVLLGTNTLTAGNDATSSEYFGVISGSGGYVKVGSISQVLSGTNTFTGGITIKAGSLYLPTNGLGSPYSLGAGPNTITIVETGRIGANKVGTSILTNRIVLANVGPTSEFDPAGSGLVQFIMAGEVSGSGGFLRSTKGSGVVALTASNTFTGGVQMDARILVLGNKNALGTGNFTIGNPVTPPGNTIELASYNSDLVGSEAIGNATTINQNFTFNGTATGFGLELGGPVTLTNGIKTITATGSGLAKISGVMSGTGGINKAGANTLVISGNNTYTGSTIISEATLALANSGSVAGSSNVTVASGATLDASGRTDGTLIVGASQTLGGLGTIIGSATGGLNMSGGGTFGWTLSALTTTPGDSDQLTLTGGNLVLGGSSKLSINFTNAASSPDAGDPFWSSAHSWTVLSLSGANNPGNSGFTTVIGGAYAAGNFTTAVSGGNILLNYTPGSASGPVIESNITGAGTTSATITWSSTGGATYQVQYKDDLNDTTWSVLGSVTATGSTASITDTTNPPATKRFYRIVVQ